MSGKKNGDWLLNGYEVPFKSDEVALKLDGDDGWKHCDYTKWIIHFKIVKTVHFMFVNFTLRKKKWTEPWPKAY